MTLPSTLINTPEWTFVGPLGPDLPKYLLKFSTLAVDGGANFLNQIDVWVGDSDSINKDFNAGITLKYSPEKDFSDLALALGLFTEPLPYIFHLWGFLGGRQDHELFNLGESLRRLDSLSLAQIIFYDKNGQIKFHLYSAGEWKLSHQGAFSIGSIKQVKLRLTGECRYPIQKECVIEPLSSFGLSNEGHGEFSIKNDGPIFIYFSDIT